MQVKNGVDCIKIAMDGVQTRENGELIAAFNQDETTAMVTEAHRLGKRVVVHARGREAILYSANAGVDLIFHANIHYDCVSKASRRKSGMAIGPTLTFPAQHHRLHAAAPACAWSSTRPRPQPDTEREYAISPRSEHAQGESAWIPTPTT